MNAELATKRHERPRIGAAQPAGGSIRVAGIGDGPRDPGDRVRVSTLARSGRAPRRRATRSSSSARARSGSRSRSISRCAASRCCCSTTTIGCRPARARSASPSARSRSGIGWASAIAWSPRACRGTSARCIFRDELLYQLRPAARSRARAAGVHQSAAVLRRGLSGREGGVAAEPRDPLEEQRRRARAATPSSATLGIDTPDGRYTIDADYVVACDGSRSTMRALLGQESRGRVFRDRFLIADVRMTAPSPSLAASGRALVLVRPAVPPQPERAAAHAARRRLAHRFPARLGRRSRRWRRSPSTSFRA